MARTGKTTPTVADMEQRIAEATAALTTAPAAERGDLEAQISAGQKALDEARRAGLSEQERLREEVAQLRREKAERETRESLEQYADTIVAGAKARADEEQERLASMMDEVLNKKLEAAGLAAGTTISTAVQRSLSEYRAGRKTPPDVSEHEQTVYLGGQAPVLLRKPRGDQAGRGRLILAIGRKALGLCSEREIIDIQRAMHIDAGYKALAEGAGADSSVSGPGGGYLVPPEYSDEIIEFLYARVVLRAAGCTIVPMKSNIYKEPRRAVASSPNATGETQPIAVSKPSYSQLILTAKKRTVLVPISRELVEDSDPSVEVDVRTDMGEEMALFEDADFLLGGGGAINSTGILTAASGSQILPPTDGTNGDALSYEIVVDMATNLALQNVVTRRPFWVCNPAITGEIRKVKSPGNNYVFAQNGFSIPQSYIQPGTPANRKAPVGEILGWPVFETTQIANFPSLYANPTGWLALCEGYEIKIGQRGEVLMDASKEGTYVDQNGQIQSAFQNDEVLYRGILRSDVGLRHGVGVVVRQGIKYNTTS